MKATIEPEAFSATFFYTGTLEDAGEEFGFTLSVTLDESGDVASTSVTYTDGEPSDPELAEKTILEQFNK